MNETSVQWLVVRKEALTAEDTGSTEDRESPATGERPRPAPRCARRRTGHPDQLIRWPGRVAVISTTEIAAV